MFFGICNRNTIEKRMKIDCIADLHGHYPKLEGGDLLIVAGDLTARDTVDEYLRFNKWLSIQDYKRKIVIAGNHDNLCQNGVSLDSGYGQIISAIPILADKYIYLCDSGTEFTYEEDNIELEMCGMHPSEEKTLKIWGSPWTKTFIGMNPRCKAFTCDTEEELAEKWAKIPEDIDILITHSPPFGIFDAVREHSNSIPVSVGSKSLSEWMKTKWKIFDSLKINVFGHIHEHGGKTGSLNMVQFINCSHVNENYEPVNKPIRVIL